MPEIIIIDLEEYKITERYISPGVGRLWQASNPRGPWEECKKINVKWEKNKMEHTDYIGKCWNGCGGDEYIFLDGGLKLYKHKDETDVWLCPNCQKTAHLNNCVKSKFRSKENKMEGTKRVYVAGAYSADNVITVLDNMRIGMRVATEILLKGYSPFAPWFDFHFQLMLRENESLTVEDYYKYSIDWLEVSDVLYVLPNSEHSKGTQAEIEFAKKNNIPIIYDINELKGLNDGV